LTHRLTSLRHMSNALEERRAVAAALQRIVANVAWPA
jgi:hypothetical protein